VCLFLCAISQKTVAAEITKRDIDRNVSRSVLEAIHFVVKMSKVKVTTHNNITGVVGYLHSCECCLRPVGLSDRAEILPVKYDRINIKKH